MTKTHAEAKKPVPSNTHAAPVPDALAHQAQLRGALLRAGVSPRLEVGAFNDPLEREADAVAARVMRMPEPEAKPPAAASAYLSARGNPVQAKATAVPASPVSPQIESSLNSLTSGGTPLDGASRAFFEPRFGRDFSGVRLHTDAAAAEMTGSLNARAFTLGNNIAFAPNQYYANTLTGRGLLAHELAHVNQQQSMTAGTAQPKLIQQKPAPASAGAATKTFFAAPAKAGRPIKFDTSRVKDNYDVLLKIGDMTFCGGISNANIPDEELTKLVKEVLAEMRIDADDVDIFYELVAIKAALRGNLTKEEQEKLNTRLYNIAGPIPGPGEIATVVQIADQTNAGEYAGAAQTAVEAVAGKAVAISKALITGYEIMEEGNDPMRKKRQDHLHGNRAEELIKRFYERINEKIKNLHRKVEFILRFNGNGWPRQHFMFYGTPMEEAWGLGMSLRRVKSYEDFSFAGDYEGNYAINIGYNLDPMPDALLNWYKRDDSKDETVKSADPGKQNYNRIKNKFRKRKFELVNSGRTTASRQWNGKVTVRLVKNIDPTARIQLKFQSGYKRVGINGIDIRLIEDYGYTHSEITYRHSADGDKFMIKEVDRRSENRNSSGHGELLPLPDREKSYEWKDVSTIWELSDNPEKNTTLMGALLDKSN